MTKKELAERINVDPKTIKNWETSKPELIKLINLGLEVEKYLGSNLVNNIELQKTEEELIRLVNLGLETEKHIKDTEKYLNKLKNTNNTKG